MPLKYIQEVIVQRLRRARGAGLVVAAALFGFLLSLFAALLSLALLELRRFAVC